MCNAGALSVLSAPLSSAEASASSFIPGQDNVFLSEEAGQCCRAPRLLFSLRMLQKQRARRLEDEAAVWFQRTWMWNIVIIMCYTAH